MRTEACLLLTACRAALGAPGSDEIPALAASVSDWEWLVRTAARHAVLPLAYRQLAALPPTHIPPSILATLRARFDENALRNLALTRHLMELIDRLQAHGIAVMPIKGPVLAVRAYGDLALRQFKDIDLVIHRRDLARAKRLLGGLGYRPWTPLAPGPEAALIDADYHLPLVNETERVLLELHWTLTRRGFGALRPDAWAWRNARHVPLLGGSVLTLSWEALLVFLCVHGSKHMWEQLGWLCDVTAVLRAAPDLDWSTVSTLSAAAGADRMLCLALSLSSELLGAVIPHGMQGNDDVMRTLAAQSRDRLFAERPPTIAEYTAFQCNLRSRFVERAAYCVHLVSAPQLADVSAVTLPANLRPLYYVLRPVRLLLNHVRRHATVRADTPSQRPSQ